MSTILFVLWILFGIMITYGLMLTGRYFIALFLIFITNKFFANKPEKIYWRKIIHMALPYRP